MKIQKWQALATEAIIARRGEQDAVHHLLKLMEEVGELAEAHNHSFSLEETGDEAADVLFALVVYCQTMGIDLEEARERKFAKLQKRWGHG